MTVKGKTIVVTGAFGALGGAVAEAAAKQGASVAALDYASAPPPGLQERLGPEALLIGGVDLVSLDAAEQAIETVKGRFGRIDALLNIAGGFRWERIADARSDEGWERMFAMNLKTALNASRAALPHLIEFGRRADRQRRRRGG